MRSFDSTGLKLCSYQAAVFSASIDSVDCSSYVFLRRFFHSRYAGKIDDFKSHLLSYDVAECFAEIEKEYGESDYGSNKLPESVLHWLGYITRYICYTREISSKKFIKTFNLKLFVDNYEVYHTQSEEWVIGRILELSGLTEDIFDKEVQTRKILKNIWML